jgi:hypothetical protein
MALFGLDAGGNTAYVQAAGDGTISNPYILQHDLLPGEVKSAWVASASGEVVISGVTATKLRVLNALVLAESGGTVQFQSGASGTTLTPAFFIASSGQLQFGNTLGVFETSAGEGLQTVVSSGISYQALVTYREVAA